MKQSHIFILPGYKRGPRTKLTKSVELLGDEMDSSFARLVIGILVFNLGEIDNLQVKVLKLNPNLTADSLNSAVHPTSVHKFNAFNQLLPAHERYRIVPKSAFKDSFMSFTEESLANILYLDWDVCKDSKGSLLSVLFGHKIKGYKIQLLNEYSAATDKSRYVLKNTIKTDGLDLELLLIDTTRKPIDLKKKQTNNSGSKLPDGFNPQDYTYVGIDGGVTFFAAAAVFRTQEQISEVRNMSFKMKALTEPSRQHQHYIRTQKLMEFEKQDSPVDIGALEFSLERIGNESWPAHFVRTAAARQIINTFYNTKTMKIRRRDLKTSLKREYQLTLNGLLKMVDTDMVTS
jgi:hypothetical protein